MPSKASVLRERFLSKEILRVVGAHNGLGAKLIEQNGFDGVWASGLEISTSHSLPDANILTMTEFFQAASIMNEATSLPVICDCDTGFGNVSNVIHMVKKYEAAGLAAVVIEDKCFPKVNSFIPGRQELASIDEFVGKIDAAKNAQRSEDFMVFARVEALIAGWGMEEALKRAHAYAEAGADGIVIHSKANTPDEVFKFAQKWNSKLPLVVIPTTFFNVSAREFGGNGFKMVIYANHGLRASMQAMDETFKIIRETDSTAAVEEKITPMKEVFKIQGMMDLNEEEKRFSRREKIQAVIPAAGDHRFHSLKNGLPEDKPICMMPLGGKSLLDRQADLLRSCGVNDICVVSGYHSDKIHSEGTTILRNPRFQSTGIVHSMMAAREYFHKKCVMLFSDIIFDRRILQRLLESPHPVTLVIDRGYQTLPVREKSLDLVSVDEVSANGRSLSAAHFKRIRKIGKTLSKKSSAHEFIGMAFFQNEGLKALKSKWEEAQGRFIKKSFYEAPSVERADFNDLMQFLIDEGTEVFGLEIDHGWSELHSYEDYERVNAHFSRASQIISQ